MFNVLKLCNIIVQITMQLVVWFQAWFSFQFYSQGEFPDLSMEMELCCSVYKVDRCLTMDPQLGATLCQICQNSLLFLCFCEALKSHMLYKHRHLRNPGLNQKSKVTFLVKWHVLYYFSEFTWGQSSFSSQNCYSPTPQLVIWSKEESTQWYYI